MKERKQEKREPTERERRMAFAPHESPRRQADGDPGRNNQNNRQKKHDVEEQTADDEEAAARSQADGYAR